MKRICFALVSAAMLLSSCGKGSNYDLTQAPEFKEETLMDFSLGLYEDLEVSDGWTNGGGFGVYWNSNNSVFDENGLALTITKDQDTYYAGEVRTKGDNGFFKYGYFGTYMKPSNVTGTASTFFTYTDENDDGNPHDEIDIEFLGKDTTKVQFNYFVDGKGGHEYMYNLGFDASKEFHQYGFYWDDDEIVWYVDNKPVYGVKGEVPTTAQKIFQNHWKGNGNFDMNMWMGGFDDKNLGCASYYKKNTYVDLEGHGRELELVKEEVYDFTDATPLDLTFSGDSEYRVSKTNGVSEISYTDIKESSYKNVNSPIPEDLAKPNNAISVDIENKGEEEVNLRIDINLPSIPEGKKTSAVNTKAIVVDKGEIRTDLEYGGSSTRIAPKEKITMIIFYEGTPSTFMAMIDSGYGDESRSHAGKVAFSNARIALFGEKAPEEEEPEEPIEPIGEVSPLTIVFASTEIYTVTPDNGAQTISYTNVAGDCYKNVTSSISATEIADKEGIVMDVENLGKEKLAIRFDLYKGSDMDTHLEKTLVAPGATNVRVDAQYGGAFATIAASGKVTIRLGFDVEPDLLMVFIDSATYGDSSTHSGSVKLSNFGAY